MKSNLVDLDVEIHRDEPIEKAVLVIFNGEKHWLPRSLIEIEYKDQSEQSATVTMPEWLAIKKGLV
jgi:hypothetical protein